MSYKKNNSKKRSQNTEYTEYNKNIANDLHETSSDNIISEKDRLAIHNSLLRYHYKIQTKLKHKLKHKLKTKLQEKINMTIMNWEIIEELKFNEWLYKQQDLKNPAHKAAFKKNRKKHSKTTINYEESKPIEKTSHVNVNNVDNDVLIMYDSNETETDDETYIVKSSLYN